MQKARKVRFVEPQSRSGQLYESWSGRWPMLGPILLATQLRQQGYDAAVYSENITGSVLDNPAEYADICSSDVVGISIMTSTAHRGYELADRIRADAPQATIAFGGVHATMLPEEAIAHGDVVVCGEAENVIADVASGAIARGIIRPEPPEDLDAIPMPDHSVMMGFEELVRRCRLAPQGYELPVMASRGCPHGCTYCSVTRMFGRKVRRQSVERAYSDLVAYMDKGFRHFFFYDDNFTADRRWTRELLARLVPLKIGFNAQCRADFPWIDAGRTQVDKELMRLFRQAGGDVMFVGYETVDDATAARWNKGYRGVTGLRKRLVQDTALLHDSGLWIHGMFVLGPQHNQQTADEIVSFAREVRMESMQISLLTPMPGTPLYEEMRPNLLLKQYPQDWDYYDGTHCVYEHASLGIEELQKVLLAAHMQFYRSYGNVMRRLRVIVQGPGGIRNKVATLWAQYRIAQETFRRTRRDMEEFLAMMKSRQMLGNPQTVKAIGMAVR